MNALDKLFSWIYRQSEGWMLMEPNLFRKINDPYPESPGEIVIKVSNLMDKKKYYKDPDITIEKLCTFININRSYLSRAIHKVYGINFCEWVNLYRIEEAKILMRKEKGNTLDLEDLAVQCGFNSVRSFTRVFSAKENMTPRQFFKSERWKRTRQKICG